MRMVIKLAGSVVLILVAATLVTWHMSRPIYDEQLTHELLNQVEIAPSSRALTFARTGSGEVILVASADAASVQGVSLAAEAGAPFQDAIDVYNRISAIRLRTILENGPIRSYDWEDLEVPVEESYPHIATGTNYRAHAEEVGLDGVPFLFPKLSSTSSWDADVHNVARLDYEVEICATPITDHYPGDRTEMAYLLCGDFTDRLSLVTNMDTSGPIGKTGFPIAKGGQTMFPVGALLVVPVDSEFYRDLTISLFVNGQLRQRSSGEFMVWNPRQILEYALEDCGNSYFTETGEVKIVGCDRVPARTMILTGTPEGVMFRLLTVWNPLAYLSEGDVVVSIGRYLGFMRNEVVAR